MAHCSDTPLWHSREQWHSATVFLGLVFNNERNALNTVAECARELREGLHAVSPFIQEHTASVCPACREVCCINVHGYYDRHDLIYIYALGLKPPDYGIGLRDGDPCQFLSGDGCRLERSVRPFRCSWYFCLALIQHMENGPARPYRKFMNRFQEVVDLRRRMLDEFSCRVNTLPAQEKGLTSLYTQRVKS